MKVLWRDGESSIRQIQETLAPNGELAYTTVQTLVLRLEEKSAVRRTRKIGNAFMFEATVSQKSFLARALDELLEVLGGSAEPLLAQLVEQGKVSVDDLRALEEKVSRKQKRGSK